MTKYYYVTNKDGTTYRGFEPFENDPDYAEAPDWVDDNRICGNALHIVSDNPAKALLSIVRKHPIAHEVEPIDLKPLLAGTYRCRAVKRIRTLSDEEFAKFFMKLKYVGNKANLACENNHLVSLNKCIKSKIMPNFHGADMAAYNNCIQCLNRCVEVEVLPTTNGSDGACIHGHLDGLSICIELGILPTYTGANWACEQGHLDCLNKCIETGIYPSRTGVDHAAKYGHLNTLKRCIEIYKFPTVHGANWAFKNGHIDCLNECIKAGIYPYNYWR